MKISRGADTPPQRFRQRFFKGADFAPTRCTVIYRLWVTLCLSLAWPLAAGAIPQTFDLRDKPWGQEQVFRLDGVWAFYPGEWVDPYSTPPIVQTGQDGGQGMSVPGFWNEVSPQISAYGIGTLSARLQVPPDRALFLQLSDVASAYRLYVNGELLAEVGRTARDALQERPMFHPVVVALPKGERELILTLQISNHIYKQIGVRRSIQITDQSGFAYLREKPLLFDVFFCGILLTIGSFYLIRFLRRRNDRASLYFSLFSLMVGSRALLVGERVLYQWEWLSWSLLQRAEHFLLYLGLAAFAAYLYELLDGGMSRRFLNFLWLSAALLTFLVIGLPIHLGTLTVLPFKGLVLACSVFVALAYWPRLRERGAGVFWFLISFIILLIALLVDLLYPTWQWMARPIVHWGMIGFVLGQALFLNHIRLWRQQRLHDHRDAPSGSEAGADSDSGEALAGLSRRKIEELERQVNLLRQDLARVTLSPALAGVESASAEGVAEAFPAEPESGDTQEAEPVQQGQDSERRLRLVELLCQALGLWELHSGKGKVQLAEESHCWRVYVDGSTVKTRTFDKYLKLQTLPGKPRWRLVVRTAQFVVQSGNLPAEAADQLRQQCEQVERLYSGTAR